MLANSDLYGSANNPLNSSAYRPHFNILKALPISYWDVLSFDPVTRTVCIVIYRVSDRGVITNDRRFIGVTLPMLR